ncbi:MAG: hypothetical protein PVJ39_03685 [Gammaproteobacteria bacterium]|jgi:hypothetical protein
MGDAVDQPTLTPLARAKRTIQIEHVQQSRGVDSHAIIIWQGQE